MTEPNHAVERCGAAQRTGPTYPRAGSMMSDGALAASWVIATHEVLPP
jgi:hypothetical protein